MEIFKGIVCGSDSSTNTSLNLSLCMCLLTFKIKVHCHAAGVLTYVKALKYLFLGNEMLVSVITVVSFGKY